MPCRHNSCIATCRANCSKHDSVLRPKSGSFMLRESMLSCPSLSDVRAVNQSTLRCGDDAKCQLLCEVDVGALPRCASLHTTLRSVTHSCSLPAPKECEAETLASRLLRIRTSNRAPSLPLLQQVAPPFASLPLLLALEFDQGCIPPRPLRHSWQDPRTYEVSDP